MRYYLSLGSNLGNREQTINEAIQQIEQQIGRVPCCSSFYYSAPWGFASEHAFCNVCCVLETDKAPLEVLQATQAIERRLGRTHKTTDAHYTDRIIDIDLIQAFDEDGKEKSFNFQFSTFNLIIPHPLWQERDFVKIPLKEIASGMSK